MNHNPMFEVFYESFALSSAWSVHDHEGSLKLTVEISIIYDIAKQ